MKADSDRLPPLHWGRYLSRLVVLALAFGAVGAALRRALGEGAAEAAVGGAIMTVPWVIVWAWQGWRQRRNLLRSAPANLTREQLAAALKASVRGPVPSDPAVRAEAARMARSNYAAYDGDSTWLALVIIGLMGVGAAVAALVFSPWWGVVSGAFVLLAMYLVWNRKQQKRRLAVLREPRTTEVSGPSIASTHD